MASHILTRTQFIPRDPAEVFAFFRNPFNLEAITPPWLRFHVHDATEQQVREGTRIGYILKWHGVPLRWDSLIASYEENTSFADEMLRGPYKRWYHSHTFRAAPGGVEMCDRVEYELPLGVVGEAVHRVVVRRQLRRIFDYRARRIAEIFG